MGTFAQYTINETDNFDKHRYPRVVGEIDGLQTSLSEIKCAKKASIIISLLKNHCIKTELLEGNRQLAWTLTSGFTLTSHVESLFSSCKHSANFMGGLEAYIVSKLA